ncbi:MAG: hypothetical protein PW843_15360 [Azospirillaceae bacterium]|nr:hypothetical protein [Azospirillaceae bacterium]
MMNFRPLRSEADYEKALADIRPFFDNEPAPGTTVAGEFDALALALVDYEAKHWPID